MALILLALCGLVAVIAGVALVSIPAALIVGGAAAIGSAYLIAEERSQ